VWVVFFFFFFFFSGVFFSTYCFVFFFFFFFVCFFFFSFFFESRPSWFIPSRVFSQSLEKSAPKRCARCFPVNKPKEGPRFFDGLLFRSAPPSPPALRKTKPPIEGPPSGFFAMPQRFSLCPLFHIPLYTQSCYVMFLPPGLSSYAVVPWPVRGRSLQFSPPITAQIRENASAEFVRRPSVRCVFFPFPSDN